MAEKTELEIATKICKHCNIPKPVSEYNKAGGGKWLQPYCKPCDSDRKKKHYIDNKDRIINKNRNRYLENRDEILLKERAKNAEYRKQNPIVPILRAKMSDDERKLRKSFNDKKYREKNAESLKVKKKEYYQKNGLEKAKQYQQRKKTDINHVTKKKLRGRIYVALKRGVKSQGTMDLLGCSIEDFKVYFASKFVDGMNWDKYIEGGIHIDHIKPCKLFDLTKEEEQKKCFHYSNLQPLWGLDNLKKGTTYVQ